MSDIEKALEMVSDVAKLRGMYDQVCTERDQLKSDFDKMAANAVALEVRVNAWQDVAEKMAKALELNQKLYMGPLEFHLQLEAIAKGKEAIALFDGMREPK